MMNHVDPILQCPTARRRPRSEEKNPRLAWDIREIVEPQTHADPELKTERRYCNLSASDVLEALRNT